MLVLEVGKALTSGGAGLEYADCVFSAGTSGCLVRSKSFFLAAGLYSVAVIGEPFASDGLSDCVLRISGEPDNRSYHTQDLFSGQSGNANQISSMIFLLTERSDSLLCSIDISAAASMRIDAIAIAKADYLHEFVVLNKSYISDLRWAVALFRSWHRFAAVKCPFFIVVPKSDLPAFENAFLEERRSGRISHLPNLMTEEWLFDRIGVHIPSDFSGWHTQQIVKLGFSKARIARNYLTLDSSMLFTKKFDFSCLMSEGAIYTAARPISKDSFFSYLKEKGEAGWLYGKIVNISESFKCICDFMENRTEETNAYISCTGMFNSELCSSLEAFAFGKGVDGFTGLIQIAPYEFAWYGEFVYSRHNPVFNPHDPHLMTLAHTPEDLAAINAGTFSVQDHHLGVMFQPPGTTLADPDAIYGIVETGGLK